MTLHQLKTQLDSILNYQIRLVKRGVNNEEINDIQIYLQNEIRDFKYPDPICEEYCYYQCTEGGTKEPKCNK